MGLLLCAWVEMTVSGEETNGASDKEKFFCEAVSKESHPGNVLRYEKPITINFL